MLVQVFAHASISPHYGLVKFLKSFVELEVLLFNETHLHQGGLVSQFEGRIRFDQVFQLHYQSAEFNRALVQVVELHLEGLFEGRQVWATASRRCLAVEQ